MDSILKACANRDDPWILTVKSRVEYFAKDLHAAECLYHHVCDSNFRSERGVPKQYDLEPSAKRMKAGRPLGDD